MNKTKTDCPVCPSKIRYTREDYRWDLKKYIDIIKTEDRAEDELYKKRLSLCEGCTSNSNGLCTHCGCFVEIRCILKSNRCPAPRPMW